MSEPSSGHSKPYSKISGLRNLLYVGGMSCRVRYSESGGLVLARREVSQVTVVALLKSLVNNITVLSSPNLQLSAFSPPGQKKQKIERTGAAQLEAWSPICRDVLRLGLLQGAEGGRFRNTMYPVNVPSFAPGVLVRVFHIWKGPSGTARQPFT